MKAFTLLLTLLFAGASSYAVADTSPEQFVGASIALKSAMKYANPAQKKMLTAALERDGSTYVNPITCTDISSGAYNCSVAVEIGSGQLTVKMSVKNGDVTDAQFN